MIEIVEQVAKNFNKTFEAGKKYTHGLLATQGRKVCTNLGKALGIGHDAIQRALTILSDNPNIIRSKLQHEVLRAAYNMTGYLLTDSTLLVKDSAKAIEGVSRQYSGSDIEAGISLTAVVWTDLQRVLPLDLFIWKKGDTSKIIRATEMAIKLAQRVNAKAVLADAAFASVEAIKMYFESHVHCLMRFHANRVITVDGYDQPAQVKDHPAFKLIKNNRIIVREATWRGVKVRIIAMKIKRHGEYQLIFLVTTMSKADAYDIAKFYRHRWKIETFFRTTKQNFGLAQCQARCLKKQEAHALAVFLAYAYTTLNPAVFKPKQVPRKRKNDYLYSCIARSSLNFPLLA